MIKYHRKWQVAINSTTPTPHAHAKSMNHDKYEQGEGRVRELIFLAPPTASAKWDFLIFSISDS